MNSNLNSDIEKIVSTIHKIECFWSNHRDWPPENVQSLLSKSRLDRVLSLSRCLHLWSSEDFIEKEEGALILAWANLGSLAESSLQFFLTVFYNDYISNLNEFNHETRKPSWLKCYFNDKNEMKNPDELSFQDLKVFFTKLNILGSPIISPIENIQVNRNSIHSYKNRHIGSSENFKQAIQHYYILINEIESRLPYPD